MTPNLHYWLHAHHTLINPRKFLEWLSHFSNIEEFFKSKERWQAIGIAPKYISLLNSDYQKKIDEDLRWSEHPDHHLISLDDEDYPALLKQISDPPLVLYLSGHKTVLSQFQIAIVGARNATTMGMTNAEQFAYRLAELGVAITSGLARGIDGAAHRGALKAKGITIGVSGTGLHHIYPASHRKLVEEIVSNSGAIISEFPLATTPQAMNFPKRNRIIAGLSKGILVIEAALKSGSLITARLALEEGREVFAIPGSIHNPLAHGCHHLIRQGAKLVEKAQDILEEFSEFNPITTIDSSPTNPILASGLPQEIRKIFDQIGYETTPMDAIILRSGLTADKVSSMLLRLELDGYIQSTPGGFVRSISKL